MWLRRTIAYKKEALLALVEAPLAALAERCSALWGEALALDATLAEGLQQLPHCHLLYAIGTNGIQLSANISPKGDDDHYRGQRLAGRPYHADNLPYRGLMLSTVYLSRVSGQHCITALQAVQRNDELVGFVAADFNVDEIPLAEGEGQERGSVWTQYKGDPAIRSVVFEQRRMKSLLDGRMDEVVDRLDLLMRGHGVYHIILHFSSSRAIFWVVDDPYRYRFHGVEEFLDPEIWLAYPSRPYPGQAVVAPGRIRAVLEQFRALREGDENIYLRSGSLNLMNGVIGLTFSCDGSHYLSVDEFLNREHPFWA